MRKEGISINANNAGYECTDFHGAVSQYAVSPYAGIFEIRDIKDYPVLYTAIIENIDVFITGDKDFLDVEIEMPEVITPTEFIEKFVK